MLFIQPSAASTPFADWSTDRVTHMPRGTPIERGAARPRMILGHVGSDLERATGSDKIARVVALVATERDPLSPREPLVGHGDRRARLREKVEWSRLSSSPSRSRNQRKRRL